MPATDRPSVQDVFLRRHLSGLRDPGPAGRQLHVVHGVHRPGYDPDEAFQAAVGQMRGKIFAYPRRPRSKASSIFLAKVTLADMETNVAEDSANVALMQGGRADFQVGGCRLA